nr:tyrosine-type recombinase/integrase [Nocardioides sp. IC4_145]
MRHCPTTGEVEAFADAFELYYPGYGRRLVLLAYATGMRPSELLGLRWDDFDFGEDEISVSVRRQMKRQAPWPATKPTENRQHRETIVWSCYGWAAESLVADARARTGKDSDYIFPNLAGVKHWPEEFDKWSRAASKAAAPSGWRWSFRWLRHAFATKSLSPRGYGFELHQVSEWLGHHAPSLTVNIYVHVSSRESRVKTVAETTAEPPR